MVGSSHEGMHRVFQKDPGLVTRTCQQILHIPFPEPREFAILNADLPEIEPVERRVDSAMTHGRGTGAAAILEPLAAALETVEPETAVVFAELVEACLVDAQAQEIWRNLMAPVNYFFKNPVAEKVRDEGREEGREEERAAMVLRILEWRGIAVSEAVRERVTGCADLGLLETWAQRAVHASSAEELFVGSGPVGEALT
ncbi:hypothetical protein OG739_19465 [Streptomyces longwoodensis]|uniref:hypothetical protein n=2 Tax=Streptomyces longwoodensis TaxID=68231 RepID=UPI0032563987